MDTRLISLKNWLKEDLNLPPFSLEPASEDASFRRYFRLKTANESLIAMDAPPEKENSEPFINICAALSGIGVHTPKIHSHDLNKGFLLLEDLGQTAYQQALIGLDSANALYTDALHTLIKIQSGHDEIAQVYSEAKLREEISLFPTWFLERHLGHQMSPCERQIWDETATFLTEACLEQPQVWVHRDFHSRNLMVTENNNPGVIDFQDLVVGPISYDLASIFKDCYIEWPRNQQLIWLQKYYELLKNSEAAASSKATFSFADLVRWYDLTGFQRHLKVLGIFCRLNYRDAKAQYLNDLPLVGKYCLEVLELYPELDKFRAAFSDHISQALFQKNT